MLMLMLMLIAGWLWKGKARLLSIVTEAHDSPILCLDLLAAPPASSSSSSSEGWMLLASAGADGLVSLWQVSAASSAHK